MEKIDGIGVIEAKEEAVKADKEQYWKLKIRQEGAEAVLTYSLWDYEAGTKVKKGEKVKFYYTEKEGTGFEGKPVTYRNIQSIGTLDKYEVDPELASKSDSQLAEQAPSESMKDIVHKESSGGRGGTPLTTNESIVRQVLYKVTGEILIKGTPAKEVNEYVKELEKGFYK